MALGAGAAGVYTNSSELWTHLEKVHNFEMNAARWEYRGETWEMR